MGSVIRCLTCRERCCDDDDEMDNNFDREVEEYSPQTDDENQTRLRSSRVPRSSHIVRHSSSRYHQAATISPSHSHDSEDDNNDRCCPITSNNRHTRSIKEFFRVFANQWRSYDTIEQVNEGETEVDDSSAGPSYIGRQSKKLCSSPLRLASTFDTSQGTPTISQQEFVLPGSDLQRAMSKTVLLDLEEQGDECVICMEGFTPDNPRMPTVCGCGLNKTYFHLPCLYQWIEQSEDCPSCRQKLIWEEF